jgi:uncharacterized protein (DUF433 family)/predicted nuclease of predicted toxin-antitoxin system
MALSIYANESVSLAIVTGLQRRGVDATCARDSGNLGLTDLQQLEYAVNHQVVLFTHDADLLRTVKELTDQITEMRDIVDELQTRVAKIEKVEVGKIRTYHPYIVRVQGVCGGRPIIEGTRITVKLIVGWVRLGMTPAEIVADYPHLSTVQIADALAYYEDHPEEVETEFAEEERYLNVELPRLQRVIRDGG